MKKFSAALLALLMVFGTVLYGCGGGTDTPDQPTNNTGSETDLSAYDYGEIDYMADITGIDMSLVEKTVGEIDRETLEKAVDQVQFSYYWKNPYTQYDLGTLSYDNKSTKRRTTGQSAENTDADNYWFAQCSEYCYQVYWELCHYEFIGGRMEGTNRTHAGDVIDPDTWVASNRTMGWDQTTVKEWFRTQARPGDIVYGGGVEVSGHLLMIVGDRNEDGIPDMLHCWPYKGGTMNSVDEVAGPGDLKIEPEGAICYGDVNQVLLETGHSPNWYLFGKSNDSHWQVYRPFEQNDIKNCHLTTDTVSRLAYNDIAITKSGTRSAHHTLTQGEEFTITEEIKNNSKSAYENLSVVEYVPNFTELKDTDANCTVDGRKLKWTVNVPAGESVKVSYTVTIKQAPGKSVTFPAGLVAGIHTKTFDMDVAKSTLSDEQIAVLTTYRDTKKLPEGVDVKKLTETAFVREFYKQALGMDITLPDTVNEFLAGIFEEKKAIPGGFLDKMLFLKDEATIDKNLFGMIPTNCIGGLCYSTGEYPGMPDWKLDRIIDIKETDFMIGDVIIGFGGNASRRELASSADLELYIYLGEGKVLAKVGGAMGVTGFDTTVAKQFKQNIFFYLRPTLNN